MKHLHLVIPELIPPQEIAAEVCAGLHLPVLEKLLARGAASSSSGETLEGRLCAAFGANGGAPVRAAADGVAAETGYWLCADPVSLQLQRAQMLLVPDVAPGREEAAALCAKLNEHFDGMGMRFFAPHPQRWYVQLVEEPQLATTPLRQVAWRDAKHYQPQGADALRWQRIMTEVQMLLYAYPANQAREARGEMVINSLWLWGGGRTVPLQRAFDVCGGDSALVAAFAQVEGIPCVSSLQGVVERGEERGLWVCDGLREAQARGDYYVWREAVQRIERECAFLLRALQTGSLQHLTLEVLQDKASRRFELTPALAWMFWRSSRSLARYAV